MKGYRRTTWRAADGVTHLTIWFKKRTRPRTHICYCHTEGADTPIGGVEGRYIRKTVVTCLMCLVWSERR